MKVTLDPLPFKEARALVKGKAPVTRAVFDKMVPEIRARAFVVTGVEDLNTVQRIRDRIADLPAGADWKDVREDVVKDLSPYLVTETDPDKREEQVAASYRRAELLLRTHAYQAYEAASHNVLMETRAAFPYWQYQTMEDGAVRPEHAALNGLILSADSPFWRDHYPPWDWGCRCEVIPLSPEDVEEIRAEDEKRNPEDKLVLEGAQLRRLERDGELARGPIKLIDPNDPDRKREVGRLAAGRFDVRAPKQKAMTQDEARAAFQWNPGDLRLPLDQLKDRYEPPVWRAFERTMKTAEITMRGKTISLLDWLGGV